MKFKTQSLIESIPILKDEIKNEVNEKMLKMKFTNEFHENSFHCGQ